MVSPPRLHLLQKQSLVNFEMGEEEGEDMEEGMALKITVN